ncbi:LD-carboxypeptidase [Massilia sp. W12]|uniref:LD-carboxypeptidase n=1 Tax=Massilia sp. W12 TaxID=3126507 RepID=UPI0030D260CF
MSEPEQVLSPVFSHQPGLVLCAPSGCAQEGANLELGLRRLQQLGFCVRNLYAHDARMLRFGGTDAARVAALHAAAKDPQAQVVLALRGSYGLSRILDQVQWDLLAESGKLFFGYSDFTALNLALWRQTGACSFSGPMLCDDFILPQVNDYMLSQFCAILQQPQHSLLLDAQAEAAGSSLAPGQKIEGVLWGGNLAMLLSLLGTPYFPTPAQTDGGILFLEDVSEHPYRIERMLLQLLHAGVLQRQRAIVLGDFSGYRLAPYDNGFDFAAMLAHLQSRLKAPIFTGLPYGHIKRRASLPIGAQATLAHSDAGLRLHLQGYPTLSAGKGGQS